MPTTHATAARTRTRSLLTAASVGLALVAATTPAGAAELARSGDVAAGPTIRVDDGPTRTPATCRGLPADVVGAGEEYVGTSGDDVVVVVGDDALVWGQFGDDLICVHGAGHYGSVVHGGPGDDVIVTYGGQSHLLTGDGDDDVLIANGGGHDLDGGDGSDVILAAGASATWIDAGPGGDLVHGSPGTDHIDAGSGADLVFGWGGDDAIDGEEGADVLHGGMGFDALVGGADHDACHDVAGAADGATTSGCEDVLLTPTAADGLALG